MKFENNQNNGGISSVSQTEEISTAEQVALAKLENDLKSLKSDDELPEIDLEHFSTEGKKKVAGVLVKIANSHLKSKTAEGLISTSRILELGYRNDLNLENEAAYTNFLDQQVKEVFEKDLSEQYHVQRCLTDALELQKYFKDYGSDFAEISKAKTVELKNAVLKGGLEVAHAAFKLLPTLESDEDLKQTAKETLKRWVKTEGNNRRGPAEEIFKAYPKSFFTLEEVQPIAIFVLKHDLEKSLKGGKDLKTSIETFPLTREERKIIVSQVLDDNLTAGNFKTVQCLVKAFGNSEELQLKASALYKQKLTGDNQDGTTIKGLDAIVTEEFKTQDEIVALKRAWALGTLGKRDGLASCRDNYVEDFKKQFNLTEEFLTNHESQQKIQEQLLYTLGYGNYHEAMSLYEKFLTAESKTDDFRTQIEATFLGAVDKHYFTLSKGHSGEKLIDLFSAEFKHSPEFRKKAIGVLSLSMRSTVAPENAVFTIEKLECTDEEIRKAKEDALLSKFVGNSNGRIYLKSLGNRDKSEINEALVKIAPDEAILDVVRAQLNDIVLQNGNFSELESLRFCAQALGIPDSQILEQEKFKEIVYGEIESKIRRGELNYAVHDAQQFKLTGEDLKNVNATTIKEGVIWWLSETNKSLETYKGLEFAPADIDRFIKFFDIPQEDIFTDPQIRKLGGKLFLALQVFYNSSVHKVDFFTKTLLITEDDMMNGVDEVLELILKKESDKPEFRLKEIEEILPSLPKGFADHAISEAYLSKIQSYAIHEDSSYGRRNNNYKDILDHLIENTNRLHTFEARQEICTQTFMHIVSKGAFSTALSLLVERKAFPFVKQEVRQECLLPEYIKRLTEHGEERAADFANSFKLNVTNISDERLSEAYQNMFRSAVLGMNISGIINYSQKAKFSREFLDSPEIKDKLETAFVENFQRHGLANALKLVESGLLSSDFVQSERVQEAARLRIPELLLDGQFQNLIALNSQFTLGLTPGEIIGLDSEKAKFFEKLSVEFPKLAEKCFGSLDALFSIWPYVHLLDPETLEKFPFLADALQENERFGVKLLLKFGTLDKLSQANIQTLYKNKDEILSEKNNIDVESRDFRVAMQQRLLGYRRNTEITETLRKAGVNVEEWLNYKEETFFTLGRDESLKFSDTIVTPIERIQETIDSYTGTVKEVLEQYKNELTDFRVPLKDLSLLNSELEKLKEQKQIAEDDGNAKKVEGITKGISGIESQILNIEEISLWDKVSSRIASLSLIKKDIFKAYDDLRGAEVALGKKEVETETNAGQKRKELVKLKNKIGTAKKEMREKVQLLGVRLAEFDNDIFAMISPALGEDRTESLIQEKNEIAEEHLDHYQSDSKTLENLFYEREDKGLVGQQMKIGVWDRNPDKDLYLGNYTDCCIRIDSSHMGSECTIADYLTDAGMQIVSIVDEKKNIPVVAAWCWVGHDDNDKVALVVDNIEANTEYSANYRAQMETKLREYLQNYSEKVGAKLVQGTSNNDLVVAKMDSAYFKLGGYNRPSGYFLEGENNGTIDDGEEEHEHEHWDENGGDDD